jgi:quercetin dioxygenase-like cupin family protein
MLCIHRATGGCTVPIVRSEDAPTFDLEGSIVTGLASPQRGATETMTYRVSLGPDSALPPHRHDHEEVFYLAAGSLTAVLDGREHAVELGDSVIIPAGVLHHSFTSERSAELIVAMPCGTTFIRPDGDRGVPPWGV